MIKFESSKILLKKLTKYFSERKSEREKFSINEQIKLETKYMTTIDKARQTERDKAIENFKQWEQDSIKGN